MALNENLIHFYRRMHGNTDGCNRVVLDLRVKRHYDAILDSTHIISAYHSAIVGLRNQLSGAGEVARIEELAGDWKPKLSRLWEDDTFFTAVKAFADLEYSSENPMLLKAIKTLQEQVRTGELDDPNDIRREMTNIYELYIRVGSANQANIKSASRLKAAAAKYSDNLAEQWNDGDNGAGNLIDILQPGTIWAEIETEISSHPMKHLRQH